MPSRRNRNIRRLARVVAAALLFAVAGTEPAAAKVHLSRKEALAWAFPDADRVDEQSLALTPEQAVAVEERAGGKLESRIVKIYTARKGEAVLGYAFIDVHTVRTLPEAFLVVLGPDGTVRTLRVLAFYEPPEYEPPERWLEQFDGRKLDRELRVGRAIHGIAGSTLTAQAVSGGVRRSLAFFEVLVRPKLAAREGRAR